MKRSNSTSMISELLQQPLTFNDAKHQVENGLYGKRVLSSSNTSLPSDIHINLPWASPVRRQPLSSPLPLMRINSPTSRQHRVEQLRKEESVDERIREAEQDREVTSQIHLNQSCIELKIDDDDDLRTDISMETLPCPVSVTTLATPFISPSSPVYSTRVRSRSLTPTSPSSSRTFTSYRRSLSPVPLRPSSLCFEPRKRKRNSELEEMDISPTQVHPPAKRAVFASPLTISPTFMHNNIPTVYTRPAFEAPQQTSLFNHTLSATPTSLLSRPLSTDLPPFTKKVGRMVLNSHQPTNSAFLPFKGMSHDTNDIECMSTSSFNPVTTIS